MKTKAFIIIALAALTMTSCRNAIKQIVEKSKEELKETHEYRDSEKWGKVVSRDIETAAFSELEVTGAVEIIFTQSDTLSVRAYGNEKAIDEYTIESKDNTLLVNLKGYDPNSKKAKVTQDSPAITVYVSAPTLATIDVSGAGDIKFEGNIEQEENLKVTINGAGDFEANNIKTSSCDIDINGAGDVDIKHIICEGDINVTVNGAGDIDAKAKCENASLVINGTGDIDLNIKCNELNAECNGAGDIKLKGECNKLTKSDGPIGGIDSRDLKVKGNINLKK